MIIIFDTYGGLCNQMYDIQCGINFCIINNIKFSFRNCSFRNTDLVSWHSQIFDKLFDISFLTNYNTLHINYDTLRLNRENTYNYESECAILLFTKDYLNEIQNIKKDFIVLKQFCAVYNFQKIVDNVIPILSSSKRLHELYKKIKNKIINSDEQYNFIHYRYEKDFTRHFNIEVKTLKPLILDLKHKFKNPNLKIYIATTNICKLINLNDDELRDIIISKNENKLLHYNFEEKAFIDYMFGLNSKEVFGHSKSSFSHMLNSFKNTSNYYDY
jgi:hypothetical protein